MNGFTGSVALSISGLSSGVLATFSPSTLTSGSAQLTLTASASAPAVSAQTVTVQGVSGSITHSASFQLTVTGPPGFTLSAPSSLNLYLNSPTPLAVTIVGQNGFNGPVTLSLSGLPTGVTAYSSTITGYPGTTNFSLTASASAPSTATVTITGTNGSLSSTATTTLDISTTPDFALTQPTGYFYNGARSTEDFEVNAYNGFSAPVTITFGTLPAGITVSPSSLTETPGTTPPLTVTVPFNASGTYTVPIQATSGSITHSYNWTINILQNQITLQATSSVSVHAGSFTTTAVSIGSYANGGVIGTFSIAATSVPAGLTITPMQATFSGQGSQTFYIQAAPNAQDGTVTFQGTWNTLTATAQTSVTVLPASTNTPTSVRSRNAYVRSDSTAQYLSFPPPTWSLYDSTTARFFAADYGTSRLNVYDAATEKQIGFIAIPNPFGIGQSASGTIYVGTMSGDIYLVDPVAMKITQRISSASIGSSGFSANAVFPRPDGTLLLESYFLVPGFDWVEGANNFALWDPATNALTTLPNCNNGTSRTTFGLPTNNGARLLLMPQMLSPATNLLCSVDLSTGNVITLPAPPQTPINGYLATLTVSPDGNTVAGFDGTSIWVLDAATLTVKNKFAASSSSSLASNPSMLIGPDNQTVYLTGADNNQHILAYNMSSGQLLGWMPSVQIPLALGYSVSVPFLQGLSTNGLLGGVMDQGFGFIDINAINAPPVGSALGTAVLDVPYGPTSGGTDTSWFLASDGTTTNNPPLGTTYFGSAAATGLSLGTEGFYATTPPGPPGPVDIITVTTDGGEQLLPEAFSYGPFVLEAPTTYATAEGGGPAQIYGYGFGPSNIPNLSAEIGPPPTDLQVLIGGASAALTGYLSAPYSMSDVNYGQMPFPLVGTEFTVPAGIAGNTASIVVTNSSGTTTANQKFTYLPATVSYPLAGVSLYDGIYDSTRDLYYFTDSAQIQVFSRTQGKWLAPIPVPQPANPYGPERLLALGLSPDHSKLAVSDAGSMAIDVIDLTNSNSVQVFGLGASSVGFALNTVTPAGVTVSNGGKLFFDTYDQNGDGAPFLYTLDPATGKSSIIGGTQALYGEVGYPQNEGNAPWTRLILSSDGQTLYFANEGAIGAVNTSTGIGTTYCNACSDLTYGGYDIVLGNDNSTIYADGAFVDTQLNLHALQSLNYRETFDANYIYGAALSADNTLLFQPGTQAIDVFDTHTGAFLERISLPQPLNTNYRALVADGKDNVLIAITGVNGSGISVVDLTSLPAAGPYLLVDPPIGGPVPRNSPSSTPLSRRSNSGRTAILHPRLISSQPQKPPPR